MKVIDTKWIKSRLTGRRGEKTELASAVGITPKQLSYILSNERRVQQEEVAGFLRFFGERPLSPSKKLEQAHGFSESSAEPFAPKPDSHASKLLSMTRSHGNHPAYYRAKLPVPNADIRRNDLLVIDLNGHPTAGDLVVCTLTDTDTGNSGTHLRYWFEPWLLDGLDALKVDEDTGNAAILGTIIAVIRGDFIQDE